MARSIISQVAGIARLCLPVALVLLAAVFFVASAYGDNDALQYLHARLYDPILGEFTAPDPIDTGGLSPYTYTFGSPTSFTDTAGLERVPISNYDDVVEMLKRLKGRRTLKGQILMATDKGWLATTDPDILYARGGCTNASCSILAKLTGIDAYAAGKNREVQRLGKIFDRAGIPWERGSRPEMVTKLQSTTVHGDAGLFMNEGHKHAWINIKGKINVLESAGAYDPGIIAGTVDWAKVVDGPAQDSGSVVSPPEKPPFPVTDDAAGSAGASDALGAGSNELGLPNEATGSELSSPKAELDRRVSGDPYEDLGANRPGAFRRAAFLAPAVITAAALGAYLVSASSAQAGGVQYETPNADCYINGCPEVSSGRPRYW